MVNYLGWAATIVFVLSYFCRRGDVLRPRVCPGSGHHSVHKPCGIPFGPIPRLGATGPLIPHAAEPPAADAHPEWRRRLAAILSDSPYQTLPRSTIEGKAPDQSRYPNGRTNIISSGQSISIRQSAGGPPKVTTGQFASCATFRSICHTTICVAIRLSIMQWESQVTARLRRRPPPTFLRIWSMRPQKDN